MRGCTIQNENFVEKPFADCSGASNYYVGGPQTFEEKTFTDDSETAKNVEVFSLDSVPLYGVYIDLKRSSTVLPVP